jgi:hypothetical protein
MADLYFGVALIALLSALVFALTFYVSRSSPRFVSDGLALLIVAGIFAYIRYAWYHTALVEFLPFSNLVILGNWFPMAASALGGLAWHRIPGQVWRKFFSVAGVIGAAAYTLIWPICGTAPRCDDAWTADGICLQTTSRTCTPACAATLLRHYGIFATEQEMAELCLTREGTTWQGLYRGLKRKSAGTDWDVEVIQCDADQVMAMAGQPLLLSVGMPREGVIDQQLARAEWGWKPGIGHSVILLARSEHGRMLIADPAPGIGREEWTANDLRLLFRGTAMRLVKR